MDAFKECTTRCDSKLFALIEKRDKMAAEILVFDGTERVLTCVGLQMPERYMTDPP